MSQRKGDLYTLGFAAVVCVVCALILSILATALKPRQLANERLDIVVNLMASVGKDYNNLEAMGSDEVFAMFESEFKALLLDKDNQAQNRDFMETELVKLNYPIGDLKKLDTSSLLGRFNSKAGMLARRAKKSRADYDPRYKMVFIYQPNGNTSGYVVPIEGYGLWDLIKGYLALEVDLNTVKGVSFYQHKETPGLGARIVEDRFKDNFKGKKILDVQGNLVSITVAKGRAGDSTHQVDGISGATLTGDGINGFIKADLERYEPYFKTLRK